MNFENLNNFQKDQKEIVTMIGALLSPLNALSESIGRSEPIDLNEIRKLQPILNEFIKNGSKIAKFCKSYDYPTYANEIRRPVTRIAVQLSNQTLPSKSMGPDIFKGNLDIHINGISEVMIAIAQIVPPTIDINIKAANPFSAYCFLSELMNNAKLNLTIIDPYIDQSIFYRYLYRLPKSIKILLVTDPKKLKENKLSEYQSVESLFKDEYPNYKMKFHENLHDRYIINEINGYSLGGSIKDAANNSDYSITQISDEKKND